MGNYVIKRGDTLSEIASKNGTTVKELAKLNNISNVNLIKAGESLVLPASSKVKKLKNDTTNDSNEESDSYPSFEYKPSENAQAAKDALDTHLSNEPGEYTSQWQTQLDDVINKILNREKFSYDLNGDALYQQYKDKYIQQGKMAMGDVIGQASAMTGGYGNSYAQSVGQQQYQASLENLNDIVPELYQMAYDKYNQEGQDLYNQYSLLGTQEEQDYGRYRDTVSDWKTDRGYLTDRADSERTFDYGTQYDEWSSGYTTNRDAIEDAYQKERDEIEDEKWNAEFGLAEEKWRTENKESNAKTYYETGGKVGYDNGSVSTENIEIMQEALGISADGKWGQGSVEAALGLTADEAWKAYQNGTLGKWDYEDIKHELDYFIANGADKSEINSYLRDELRLGRITQADYYTLKETYAPRGYTYGIADKPATKTQLN